MAKHVVVGLLHEENGAFGVSFPDFPGCISGGGTAEEAYFKGLQALSFHIDGMVEDGDPLPHIHSLTELVPALQSETRQGAIIVPYVVDVVGKAQRINVSIEEGLLAQIDRDAAERGESRSAFLAEAARARLRQTG